MVRYKPPCATAATATTRAPHTGHATTVRTEEDAARRPRSTLRRRRPLELSRPSSTTGMVSPRTLPRLRPRDASLALDASSLPRLPTGREVLGGRGTKLPRVAVRLPPDDVSVADAVGFDEAVPPMSKLTVAPVSLPARRRGVLGVCHCCCSSSRRCNFHASGSRDSTAWSPLLCRSGDSMNIPWPDPASPRCRAGAVCRRPPEPLAAVGSADDASTALPNASMSDACEARRVRPARRSGSAS